MGLRYSLSIYVYEMILVNNYDIRNNLFWVNHWKNAKKMCDEKKLTWNPQVSNDAASKYNMSDSPNLPIQMHSHSLSLNIEIIAFDLSPVTPSSIKRIKKRDCPLHYQEVTISHITI